MRIRPIIDISSATRLSNFVRAARDEQKTRKVAHKAMKAMHKSGSSSLKDKKGRRVTSHRPDLKKTSDTFRKHS